MPYTSYALMTDDDIKAMYAYFMNGVAAVDEPSPPTNLPFPFNIRLMMAGWNLLFLESSPFAPDPAKSAEWNCGAYLVRGLAHCGVCHTPRNLMMAERSSSALGGTSLGAWYAPNITSDPNSGIGGWNAHELSAYLKQGRAVGKAQAAGPMREAVDHSFSKMTDADIGAMVTYVKSVPAVTEPGASRPAFAWGGPSHDVAAVRGATLPTNGDAMTGPQLYSAYCATCHNDGGQGTTVAAGMPSLFHNTALGQSNADNVVMVILNGIERVGEKPGVIMPGFGKTLSDTQVSVLTNYLQQTFGNPDASVSPTQVNVARNGGPSSPLPMLARIGMALAVLVVIALLLFLVSRRRRRTVSAA